VVVREERDADHAAVYDVLARAFGRRTESDLVVALRASAEPRVSLVAVDAGSVIGHVFLSPVAIAEELEHPCSMALGPLGVAPERQRAGAGSLLVRDALERARRAGHPLVVVLGNPAYYARFGFVRAAPHGLRYGHPAHEPAFQVVELAPGALAGRRGVVRYHPAFSSV